MRVESTRFGASGLGPRNPWDHDAGPPSEPPLYDPYFGRDPGAPAGPLPGAASPARVVTATWSLVLGAISVIGGLVTGPIAVLLGLLALRKSRRLAADGWDTGSPRLRAKLGIAFGATAFVAYGAVVAFAVHRTWWAEQREQVAQTPFAPVPPARVLQRPIDPDGPIPMTTQDVEIGQLHVVTLGAQEPSLRDALTREAAAAKSDGKEMLAVVIDTNCEPCDGLQASLRDPRMQEVMKGHRLVFVYVQVFVPEIIALGMDARSIAGFYLFEPDLTVRDAIHGGEWGEDIATNIVPVLGPFLRGELAKRRYDWRAASAFPDMDRPAPGPRGPRLPPSSRPVQPGPQPPGGAVWL